MAKIQHTEGDENSSGLSGKRVFVSMSKTIKIGGPSSYEFVRVEIGLGDTHTTEEEKNRLKKTLSKECIDYLTTYIPAIKRKLK